MTLPTISHPTFTTTLSSGQTVKYRPFTVREEKIFLIADESKDEAEIANSVKQVITNCTFGEVDVNKTPIHDIEYIFLQLRAKSVNDVCSLKFRDKEDNQIREFEIDLDKIKPESPEDHSTQVNLSGGISIEFRYPTLNDVGMKDKIDIIVRCMSMIYDSGTEETFDASAYTIEEKAEFINKLNTNDYNKIVSTFIDTMPKMKYRITYKNSLGHERVMDLEGIRDFFPWG